MPRARADVDLVIIGAGAAGLAAAHAVHNEGIDLLVLEARDRIGGRVQTIHDDHTSMPIELGAEFVHGRAPGLQGLLDEASLRRIDINGRRWYASHQRLRPFDDFWDRLDRVMRRLTSTRHTDESFDEFLRRKPGGRSLSSERTLARQFVEGFHGADPDLISAAALAESGSPGDDTHERRLGRVLDGYDSAMAWLAAPVSKRIRLSSIVTAVEWEPGAVSVEFRSANGHRRSQVTAQAVIITVPLGVLKARDDEDGAIRFAPALTEKARALDRLTMGSALRVALRLADRFWIAERFASSRHADELDTLSFLHGSDRDFPTWWTAYPLLLPVVMGWCGGPRARELSALPSPAVIEHAVRALARLMHVDRRRLSARVDAAWTHDWEHDPYARGAYSYQMVGGADAPAALAQPMRRTLFFAGEATETSGATGTVHGAIATGTRAAQQVSDVFRATARRRDPQAPTQSW